GTERLLSFSPRVGPGFVSDLVAARLADHRAIAFDLALRTRTREAGGRHHVVGRLFPAPALRMDAGVDHQARRAEEEGLEETGAAERVVVIDSELAGELLRI